MKNVKFAWIVAKLKESKILLEWSKYRKKILYVKKGILNAVTVPI